MESKYLKECRRLMKLRHRELAELYKLANFPYCGGSKRRKLRMAARLTIQKYHKGFEIKASNRNLYVAIDKYWDVLTKNK